MPGGCVAGGTSSPMSRPASGRRAKGGGPTAGVGHGARVLGHDGESVVGKRDEDLIDRATAARVAAEDRRVATEGQVLRAEHDMPSGHDGMRTFQTHVFPLLDGGGKTYAIGGISLDITDLK